MDGAETSGVNIEFQLALCIAHSSTLNIHKMNHQLLDDVVREEK